MLYIVLKYKKVITQINIIGRNCCSQVADRFNYTRVSGQHFLLKHFVYIMIYEFTS